MEDHMTHATHATDTTQYEQANASAPDLTPEPESLDSATIIDPSGAHDGGSGADPDGNTPHNTGVAGPEGCL